MSKGAIVYLVSHVNDDLIESLRSLERCFLQRFPHYPVLLFHDGISLDALKPLFALISTELRPVLLDNFLRLPDYAGLELSQVNRWNQGLDGGRVCRLGYIQMCRFFAAGLYHHPAMEEFDYYWRFDDDSFLLAPLDSDPFVQMEANGWIYGYRSIERENVREIVGLEALWETTKAFARTQRLSVRQVKRLTCNFFGKYKGINYYNNFEINKISYWRHHHQHAQFIDYLDRSLGFYRFRWGDANVRTLAIGLFVAPEQVHHFKEIPYRHNDHWSVTGSDCIIYSQSSQLVNH